MHGLIAYKYEPGSSYLSELRHSLKKRMIKNTLVRRPAELPTSKNALPFTINPLSSRYSEMMSKTMEAKNNITRFFDIFLTALPFANKHRAIPHKSKKSIFHYGAY